MNPIDSRKLIALLDNVERRTGDAYHCPLCDREVGGIIIDRPHAAGCLAPLMEATKAYAEARAAKLAGTGNRDAYALAVFALCRAAEEMHGAETTTPPAAPTAKGEP